MENSVKPIATQTQTRDLDVTDLVPSLTPFPWEDASQYEALQGAVLAQLDPNTPHERILALRIAESYWTQSRSLQLSRDVFMAAYRKAAVNLLTKDLLTMFPDQKITACVDGLLSADPATRAAAVETLSEYGVTEEEIRGQAYLQNLQAIEALERRPARDDERRRALMQEYDALKQANQLGHVPDAEVV